jgi:hypothetical protein
VENPSFLFLEGSAGAAVAPVVATAALPDASLVRADASAVRAASSTNRQALPPLRLLVRGARDSTS